MGFKVLREKRIPNTRPWPQSKLSSWGHLRRRDGTPSSKKAFPPTSRQATVSSSVLLTQGLSQASHRFDAQNCWPASELTKPAFSSDDRSSSVPSGVPIRSPAVPWLHRAIPASPRMISPVVFSYRTTKSLLAVHVAQSGITRAVATAGTWPTGVFSQK